MTLGWHGGAFPAPSRPTWCRLSPRWPGVRLREEASTKQCAMCSGCVKWEASLSQTIFDTHTQLRHTHNFSHTWFCHTHLSHTQLYHTQLFTYDPPPPPLSFLPSPSCFNFCFRLLEEVDLWGYPVLYFFGVYVRNFQSVETSRNMSKPPAGGSFLQMAWCDLLPPLKNGLVGMCSCTVLPETSVAMDVCGASGALLSLSQDDFVQISKMIRSYYDIELAFQNVWQSETCGASFTFQAPDDLKMEGLMYLLTRTLPFVSSTGEYLDLSFRLHTGCGPTARATLGRSSLSQDPKFRTVLCWHWQHGECPFGADCTYAHGPHELRLPQKSDSIWVVFVNQFDFFAFFCHVVLSDKPLSTKTIASDMDYSSFLSHGLGPQRPDFIGFSFEIASQASCASSTRWGSAKMDRIAVSATSCVLVMTIEDLWCFAVAQKRDAAHRRILLSGPSLCS